MSGIKIRLLLISPIVALLLAGCTPMPKQVVRASEIKCEPPGKTSLEGNWLGQRNQAGVAGSFQVWVQLRPDGTMSYTERLLRNGKPAQSLRETGCWQDDSATGTLLLRTLKSNGVWVEPGDPIYVNRYPYVLQSSGKLKLQDGQSAFLLKRMPNDYRLPF